MSENIIIRPEQKEHYLKLVDVVENNYAYIDNSPTGTGKTIITLSLCKTFGWPLMVVALKSNLVMWESLAKKYDIEIKCILSYQSLQGVVGKNIKHGLLTRNGSHFKVTDKFKNWVKQGLLVVFDECQKLKNDNLLLASCHELVIEIVKQCNKNSASRIGLLSATPFDKLEHSSYILKMCGIITEPKLYEYQRNNKSYRLIGLQQAFDWCDKINPQQTRFIMRQAINRTTINKICIELYINIVKDYLSSAMPPTKFVKDAKNGYYNFSDDDNELLEQGISMLSKATNYCPKTNKTSKTNNWSETTNALIIIEKSKVNTMIRLTREKLDNDPNCKVVLFFKYLQNISFVYKNLKKYGSLYIDGSKNEQERKRARDFFQENNNNHRVIISNTQVNGIGVELDDKFGNHPRFMFMIPDYALIHSHQAAGRICRAESKSIGTIRFVYSKKHPIETNILNAMLRKTRIVRDIIIDINKDILLPGEYGIEIEGISDQKILESDPIYKQFIQLQKSLKY